MRQAAVAILCAGLLVATGCGSEGDGDAAVSQSLTMEAFDFYYEPTSLTADVGAEVTIEFTNNGSVSHSWTSPDLDADIEVSNGEEGTVTFTAPNEPGSYDFFCSFHPDEMQGTISIGGSDEPVEEEPEEDEDDEDVDVDVDTESDEDTSRDDY